MIFYLFGFFAKLLTTAMSQASDLFRQNDDEGLLKALRVSGLAGDLNHVEELTVKFSEHQEQLEEVKEQLNLYSF